MNNKIFPVAVTALVMLSAFAGAGMQNAFAFNPSADDAMKVVSLNTDKDIYHSNDEMAIVLSVYSPESISDVLVEVSGVKSRRGVYFVSLSNKTNLIEGENKMTFTKKLPSCSPCAGIGLGTYFINVSVAYGDEVVNATHSIAITPNPNQITHVNIVVEEAKRLIESEDITLLDVRTEAEFNSAHISDATLIPVSELSNRTEEMNKSKKIVVYSGNGSNGTIASGILIENGFERVYNVLGGINAWEESEYPVGSTATSTLEQTGFEAVLAIAGLLTVAYWIKRRKVSFK